MRQTQREHGQHSRASLRTLLYARKAFSAEFTASYPSELQLPKVMAKIETLGDTCANVNSCAAFRKFLQAKEEDEEEKVFEPRLDFVLEFDKAPKLPDTEIASKYFQKTQGLPLSNLSLRQDLVEQNGDLAALLDQARTDVLEALQKHHEKWIQTTVKDQSGDTILDGFHS